MSSFEVLNKIRISISFSKCMLHVYPSQPSTDILSIAKKSKLMLPAVKRIFLILNCCVVTWLAFCCP
jgi:hypothetical protein